jgi:hypothetical protein
LSEREPAKLSLSLDKNILTVHLSIFYVDYIKQKLEKLYQEQTLVNHKITILLLN